MVTIKGNSKVISTSKIKKIIAIKKNWSEKGRREDDFGSNPHSNGEFFSRSEKVFFDKILARIITIVLNVKIKSPVINITRIIYTKFN